MELEFSPDTCPGVGLLDPMVTLVFLKSFFKYTSELFSVYISIYKNRIAIFFNSAENLCNNVLTTSDLARGTDGNI